MTLYDYKCPNGHRFERLKPVADREHADCPECGEVADKVIVGAPVLDPRLGVDPSFPSLARKWERKHRNLATGRMRDSNNTRYGTDRDLDREAWDKQRIYEN